MAIDSLPMLGPHESRELELLLSGEKPIAFFYEGLPDEFLPYLESGILKSRTKTTTTRLPNIQIENILIYKDVAIEQVDELISVIELSLNQPKAGFVPELERRIGQLLGYREEDIEFYLQHLSRNKK
ncbi:hemin receptor [Acinetobacter sp. XH1639]|uniref:hemin receptor n=1 Tax=Acinetobacter sp. XH1639 TaxID=3157368 RepID=UPI0032B5772C